MTFQQLYTWLVEFEPLPDSTAQKLLRRILDRLLGRRPPRLPPPKDP